jgi:hypothetical protein
MNFLICGLLAAIIAVMPFTVRADTIVEPFELTIPTTILLDGTPEANNIFSTVSPQFTPPIGGAILHNIRYELSGPATWTSSSSPPGNGIDIVLIGNSKQLLGGELFSSPGEIFLDLSFDLGSLGPFATIGVDIFTPNVGDTFASEGALLGTVTFDFTPFVSVEPVPVPSLSSHPIASLALLVGAAAWLSVGHKLGRRRKSLAA